MRIFSQRSLKNLEGVHPDLVRVCEIALQNGDMDFTVIEGVRTIEKQREYVARGASKTMKSYHLKHGDGYGHAVDLYPFFDGKLQGADRPKTTEERKRNEDAWRQIAVAMKAAAAEVGVRITWGGDWKSFVDMPHFQIEA